MKNYFKIFILIITILTACTSETEVHKNRIEANRERKNKVFADKNKTPLAEKYQSTFNGLSYFPIDIKWNIPAKIERTQQLISERLVMNNGEKELFVKYGNIIFTIEGKEYKLSIYENLEASALDLLFLPFTDKSNQTKTYEGGRYVEVARSKTFETYIDFNNTFNPYCVFNENYVCPVPPAENYIDAFILSGEKRFKK
jgi:uncharacterized protein